jgi:hypothetical protein
MNKQSISQNKSSEADINQHYRPNIQPTDVFNYASDFQTELL